jgi:hypothetical protein
LPCPLYGRGTGHNLPAGAGPREASAEPVGTAEAFAFSREGAFFLHESFVFDLETGTGTGTGEGTEIDFDTGQVSPVEFDATFNTTPTENPNVFLDTGVVNIRPE